MVLVCVMSPSHYPLHLVAQQEQSRSSTFPFFDFHIQLVTSLISSASHFSHLSRPLQALCHFPYLSPHHPSPQSVQWSPDWSSCCPSSSVPAISTVRIPLLNKSGSPNIFPDIQGLTQTIFYLPCLCLSSASILTLQPDRKCVIFPNVSRSVMSP